MVAWFHIKYLPVFVFLVYGIIDILAINVNVNELNLDSTSEQLLIERLFKNYNKKVRPPGTIQVKFALILNQIVNLIEKDQIIVLNAFIDHEWTDERLSWNPEKFNNISLIRVSSDVIWTPDTFIYTTADQSGFLLPQIGAYFVVNHDGGVFWPNPLTQMRVRCRMAILWFPFDDQLCVIVFGSWSYTYHYMNYSLMTENPSLENYTENNEWILVGYKPFRYEIKYANWIENDTFSEIRYKILIQRKPLFVIQNCVIPAIMLCILTLASFFIPFAQEMQIGISIMLAFSVFKLRLSDDVPVQSDSVPLVNIYFTICMSFSLAAMIWFSIVNVLRENKRVPCFVRKLVLNYMIYLNCSRFITKKPEETNVGQVSTSVSRGKEQATTTVAITQPKTYSPFLSMSPPPVPLHSTLSDKVKIPKRMAGISDISNVDIAAPTAFNALSNIYNGSEGRNSPKITMVVSAYPKQSVVAAAAIDSVATSNNTNLNRVSQFSDMRPKRNKFYISNEKDSTSRKKKFSVDSKLKNASEFEFENELDRLGESKSNFLNDYDDINCDYDLSCSSGEGVWLPQKKMQAFDGKSIKSKYLYIDQTIETKFESELNSDTATIKKYDSNSNRPQTQRADSSPSSKSVRSERVNRLSSKTEREKHASITMKKTNANNSTEVSNQQSVVLLRKKSKNSNKIYSSLNNHHSAVVSRNSNSFVKTNGKNANEQVMKSRSDKDQITDIIVIKILNLFMFYLFLLFAIILNLAGLWLFPYYLRKPQEITED